jgi:hypothetical protein
MILSRTVDAEVFNRVANHPGIRPGLGNGAKPLDFTAALKNLANFGFIGPNGGFIVIHLEPGRYELHTLFDPGCRGSLALKCAAEVFRFLFVETDCTELVTRVPANLKHADFMARRAGFRPLFHLDHGWIDAAGQAIGLQAFSLTLDEWRTQDPTLVAEGEAFHELLRQAGDGEPLHPHEDADHERAAGMASLMARAGNHKKAVQSYGRWAVLSNYRPIQLLSLSPAVYDVGNALVMARNGSLEVLKWLRQQ